MEDYQKVSKNYNFDLILKAYKLQIRCFFSRYSLFFSYSISKSPEKMSFYPQYR